VAGKRIVLIDDSIVRGTTSTKIVQMMPTTPAPPRCIPHRLAADHAPRLLRIDTPGTRKLLAATHDLEGMRRSSAPIRSPPLDSRHLPRHGRERAQSGAPAVHRPLLHRRLSHAAQRHTAQEAPPRQLSLLSEAS